MGCGNKWILINLAKKEFKNLHGIDISPPYIEDEKRRCKNTGIKYLFNVEDIQELDEFYPLKRFDTILSIWSTVIGYYQSPQQYIKN